MLSSPQHPSFIIDIPENEKKQLNQLIQAIRNSQEIVEYVLLTHAHFASDIQAHNVSQAIRQLREEAWQAFLLDEVAFNVMLMQKVTQQLKTPQHILDALITPALHQLNPEELLAQVKLLCGDYSGRVFPYIYAIALSNTNSRRSRAGKTFEAIIYKTYDILGYPYDSQGKAGRKMFDALGLGKKVDSILPSLEAYKSRRNKTIIGTMKTSLRERWQEVAEEIERTKIPEIHLLTADEDISKSKAQEMANHNIIVVTYDWIANSDKLREHKNIISFEDYMFEEIPNMLKFWS